MQFSASPICAKAAAGWRQAAPSRSIWSNDDILLARDVVAVAYCAGGGDGLSHTAAAEEKACVALREPDHRKRGDRYRPANATPHSTAAVPPGAEFDDCRYRSSGCDSHAPIPA